MKPSYILFLKRLYGHNFNREFARECNKEFNRFPCFNLEDLLRRFQLYQGKNCSVYTNVYNFNPEYPIPLKKDKPKGWTYPYESEAIIDRIFIDFDKDLTSKAKKEYDNLLTKGSKQDFYQRLIEQGQAKGPIKEGKQVYKYIKDNFQGDPLLVFSGAKGCHLYILFEPVQLQYPKEVLKYFMNKLEDVLKLEYVDPKIKGELSRVSRIPTSKHPKTDLYSHPWKYDYSYNEIIENSKIKEIPFDTLDLPAARSNLGDLLIEIDNFIIAERERLQYTNKLRNLTRKPTGKGKDSIKIAAPEDILLLNRFPCFNVLPYTHDSRIVLALVCLWSGLNPEDTVQALRIFTEDKGYYDPGKHLHNIQQVKALKKYVFTCNSMKSNKLCKCKGSNFCNNWFYLKLDLPDEFYKIIENYKNYGGESNLI